MSPIRTSKVTLGEVGFAVEQENFAPCNIRGICNSRTENFQQLCDGAVSQQQKGIFRSVPGVHKNGSIR